MRKKKLCYYHFPDLDAGGLCRGDGLLHALHRKLFIKKISQYVFIQKKMGFKCLYRCTETLKMYTITLSVKVRPLPIHL